MSWSLLMHWDIGENRSMRAVEFVTKVERGWENFVWGRTDLFSLESSMISPLTAANGPLILRASRVQVSSLEKWARTIASNTRQRTCCNQISILQEYNMFCSYYKYVEQDTYWYLWWVRWEKRPLMFFFFQISLEYRNFLKCREPNNFLFHLFFFLLLHPFSFFPNVFQDWYVL